MRNNVSNSNAEKMIQKLSEEISGFHEALHEEVENREKGREAILKLIEDTHSSILTEIQLKKREREETEESLLNLLENTCQKMERNIFSS